MPMKQVQLNLNDKNQIKKIAEIAAEVLENKGVIVYPTDTLYGLGANALDEDAVLKVYKIKKRDRNKPLPIITKDLKMVKKIACVDSKVERILNKIWPGAITIVLRKKDVTPYVLTGNGETVAVRIPDNEFISALINKIDFPITATSANISREPNLLDPSKIISKFKSGELKPDLFVDAGKVKDLKPSTIVDLTTGIPKILRAGIVGMSEMKEFFEKFQM
ncbi:MAG: L-threonylcarbamoyladenylate synthase [Patescibacteria group bacterium]|nr:L-threonylcarbamoyladenylate synthase [Patescibacteria group bacterium]